MKLCVKRKYSNVTLAPLCRRCGQPQPLHIMQSASNRLPFGYASPAIVPKSWSFGLVKNVMANAIAWGQRKEYGCRNCCTPSDGNQKSLILYRLRCPARLQCACRGLPCHSLTKIMIFWLFCGNCLEL